MIAPRVDAEIVGYMDRGIVRYEWRGGSVARIGAGFIVAGDGERFRLGGLDVRIVAFDPAGGAAYVMRAGLAAELVALACRAGGAVERAYRRACYALGARQEAIAPSWRGVARAWRGRGKP